MSNLDTMDEEFTKPVKNLIKEAKVSPNKTEKNIEESTVELDRRQKNLINVYKNEARVPVRIAPSYAKYFGRVMRVSINGISVAVRCDGSTIELPESYAAEVLRRMSEMDKYERKLNKMSNYQNNLEARPGQLNFFG